MRVGNFGSSNYIEYEKTDARNEILSIKVYPNRIIPYLNIINDLKNMRRKKFN